MNWDELSKAVIERDGNKCALCPIRTDLSAHHIQPKRFGGKDNPSNLISLCLEHHKHADNMFLKYGEGTIQYRQLKSMAEWRTLKNEKVQVA